MFKEYLLLAVFIIASITLLNYNNNLQIRAIRSYTVGLIGFVQNTLSIIPNIFELKRDNEVLRQLAVNLSDEVNRLREARVENINLRAMLGLKERAPYKLTSAEIVGKTMHLLRNTITLNIGEEDGVRQDMPIINEIGLVGKIIATSKHYSIGQILYNKDFHATTKIQRTRIDGIIAWEGGENLLLTNIPKTEDVRVGDVVITSEYSKIYPPEIKVGVIASITERPGELFKRVDVVPSVDFSSLEHVFVITSVPDTEKISLEGKILKKK